MDSYMNISRKRNTLELLDVYLRSKVEKHRDDGVAREVMSAHLETVTAIRADVDALAGVRDHADNNPIIAEARRWYSRLNKSELLDSTTATRVGVLLCGLDSYTQRLSDLRVRFEHACGENTAKAMRILDLEEQRDELLAALREARSNLRHAKHCRSNHSMVPPQGFNRYPCDCGSDHAREVATVAIAKAEGRANELPKGGGLSCEGAPAAAATEETGSDRPAAPILTCTWTEIEADSGIYDTCNVGNEFHLDEGCELWPHCMWCGKLVELVSRETSGSEG